MAVCQPCVPVLAAVAVMSEDRNPAQPKSMTLMAGPIDASVTPTSVNELATSRPIEWFEQHVIATVPWSLSREPVGACTRASSRSSAFLA